jgi:hypothetical protein
MPPRASSLSPIANGSCDGKYLLKLRRDFLPMVNAVGDDTQSQRPDG